MVTTAQLGSERTTVSLHMRTRVEYAVMDVSGPWHAKEMKTFGLYHLQY